MAGAMVRRRLSSDANEDPLAALDSVRLQRLSLLTSGLLAGRPQHADGTLRHGWTASGQDFIDHRPYTPFDDPRGIDWRASARRREPVVRRYHDERAGEWLLALDRSASMGVSTRQAPHGTWRLAVQLAGAAAFMLTQQGHRVMLALFSHRVDAATEPGRGAEARRTVYRLLRDWQPVAPMRERPVSPDTSCPERCAPLAQGRRVLLISDCLRPDGMAPALALLARAAAGVELLRLTAPAQPLGGATRLADAETGSQLTVSGDEATARGARARLDAVFETLASRCRELGIPATVAAPDANWDQVIMAHLLRHPHAAVLRRGGQRPDGDLRQGESS